MKEEDKELIRGRNGKIPRFQTLGYSLAYSWWGARMTLNPDVGLGLLVDLKVRV